MTMRTGIMPTLALAPFSQAPALATDKPMANIKMIVILVESGAMQPQLGF